jgi:hypothetical protein
MGEVFVEADGVRLDCNSFKAVSARRCRLIESIGEETARGAVFGERTLVLELTRTLTGAADEYAFSFDSALTLTAVNGETRRIYTGCLVEEISETHSAGKVTQSVRLRALGLIEDGERV